MGDLSNMDMPDVQVEDEADTQQQQQQKHMPGSNSAAKFSCLPCRSRKLKCARELPSCNRCAKAGVRCEYPSSRKRHVVLATRPRVKELEARLNDLEGRLNSETSTSDGQPTPDRSSSDSGSDLIGTGRYEQLPPQDVIEELTNIYFARIHSELPMLHPTRYPASLYLPAIHHPPMCLQYAVLALGATLSPTHKHLAQVFYKRSRQYLDADEVRGDGQDFVTLAHVQSCALLELFEVQSLWFSRACMTLARSVRLAQILGLDTLDAKNVPGRRPTMPPARDWCEVEERRRTFWVIFCHDRIGTSTTGWPIMIDWRKIRTLLPASEEAYMLGMEEPSITIRQALRNEGIFTSSFAFRLVAVHLFHECLDLNNNSGTLSDEYDEEEDDGSPGSARDAAFWARHQKLDDALSLALVNLPTRLQPLENTTSADAISTSMLLHLSSLCIHRAGSAAIKRSGETVTSDAFWRTQARLLPAAQEIFTTVAVIADVDARFRNNPMVPFASFMAASVFLEHFALTGDRNSEERLAAMMALLMSVAGENPVTASVTVQLAHQVKKSGVDPGALDRVRHLMGGMDPGAPLMGEEDGSTGGVIFCPFEHHKPGEVPI